MKQKANNCDLRTCFLCQRCLPEWIPAVEAHKKTFHYKKGEVIFEEGQIVLPVDQSNLTRVELGRSPKIAGVVRVGNDVAIVRTVVHGLRVGVADTKAVRTREAAIPGDL